MTFDADAAAAANVGSPYLWFDIDLEEVPDYPRIWKPDSLEWALGVNWAKVNGLVRDNPGRYPTGDHHAAIQAARAAGLVGTDLEGLSSQYQEPIYATPPQVTAGGHRITAMRRQGIRWAMGWCHRDDVGDGADGTIDELHVYVP